MQNPDEYLWVQQAARGDRKAFALLVDCYWENVRRWLKGMTGSEHQAEDIAQDAFLKAWVALPTFRHNGTFRAWLFQIARRCWVDTCRRSDPCLEHALPDEVSQDSVDPSQEMELAELRQQIQLALASLPAEYRAAYLLFSQEELPYAEIAEILGISEENARWRVYRARKSLKHLLNPYLQCRES